jgi:hypothetical protein
MQTAFEVGDNSRDRKYFIIKSFILHRALDIHLIRYCSILLVSEGMKYSDLLRAGRSGDRVPVKAKFSSYVQTSYGAHQASCEIGTGYLSWG